MSKKKNFKKNNPSAVSVSKPAPASKTSVLLWFILAAGFLVRFAYLKLSKESPFYEPLLLDPAYYHEWAQKVSKGIFDKDVFYGLPLYPYFMGAFYKLFGVTVDGLKLLQVCFGIVTLFFIYKIGVKLKNEATGLLAAAIGVFYGPLFFHETIFIPEAIGIPLYAAAFYTVLLFLEKPSVRKGVLLGVLFGLSALTKAGILIFFAVFSVIFAFRSLKEKKSLLPILAVVLCCLGTLAPITLHNFIRGHDKVLLTSHSGFNFYIGNNSRSEGVYVAPEGVGGNVVSQMEDARAVAERDLGRELRASEVSKYWSDKGWEFIRQNPGQFLVLSGRKLLLFFDAREISDVDDYTFSKRVVPFLNFPWLDFAVLGPLLFLGLFLSLPALKNRTFVYLWIGAYLLGLMTFFVNARYRLPLLSVFFPLAAAGFLDLRESLKKTDLKKIAIGCVALAAGFGIGHLNLVSTNWARDYVNAGDALMEQKDYDGAMRYYQEAVKADPESSKAYLAMGIVKSRLGQEGDAKELYKKACELNPKNAQALNNLGYWYEKAGDLDLAKEYFLKALEYKPSFVQAHNNLGMVYGKQGDLESAIREFEMAIHLNPENVRALTNLGLVYFQTGREAEGEALWRRAVAIDPQFPEAQKALAILERRRATPSG